MNLSIIQINPVYSFQTCKKNHVHISFFWFFFLIHHSFLFFSCVLSFRKVKRWERNKICSSFFQVFFVNFVVFLVWESSCIFLCFFLSFFYLFKRKQDFCVFWNSKNEFFFCVWLDSEYFVFWNSEKERLFFRILIFKGLFKIELELFIC